MKKLLALLFVFGFLFIGSQANASFLSDALSQIQNLKNEILLLKSSLKASVLDASIGVTSTTDLTPRISYWSGKVNQHVDVESSTWQTDADGRSGAELDKLTYCKKFYPNTTSVEDYKNEVINSWHAGGNIGNYVNTRLSYKCVQGASVTPLPTKECKILSALTVTPITVTKGAPVTVKWNTENCNSIILYQNVYPYETILSTSSGSKTLYPNVNTQISLIVKGTDGITKYSNALDVKVSEPTKYQCNDGIDNDKDGYRDADDTGCWTDEDDAGTYNPNDNSEANTMIATPSITVLSPNKGETFVQGQSNKISWTGGKNKVQVGLVDSSFANNDKEGGNGILGWIELNGKIDSNITWDGKSVKDLMGNFLSVVLPGKYKILTVSENSMGNYCAGAVVSGASVTGGPCNFDLSDLYFTINSKDTNTLAVIKSPMVSSVTSNSATISANLVSLGNPAVTVRGVCVSEKSNNIKALSIANSGNCSWSTDPLKTGIYKVIVNGLRANTTYLYRVFASVHNGNTDANSSDSNVVYSLQTDFTTLPIPSNETSSVKIISPNGGETYKIGDNIIVKWTSNNIAGNISEINLVPNDMKVGYGITLDKDIPNTGTYTINLSSSYLFSNDYSLGKNFKVNIIAGTSKLNNIIEDSSDNLFTINSLETKTCPVGCTCDSKGDTISCPINGTWKEKTSSGPYSWSSNVVSSSDGSKLVAGIYDGSIYTSSNSGSTWVKRTSAGVRYWTSISSSLDGSKIVAVPGYGSIFVSLDSGATWLERTSTGSQAWHSVTYSPDGTKIIAISNSYIHISTDSGLTWKKSDVLGSFNSWQHVASSYDGMKLAAVSDEYIYTSTDGGMNWVKRMGDLKRNWYTIDSSSDGTKLVAAINGFPRTNAYIYTSNDSGITWVERASAGSGPWVSVSSSSDGKNIFAVAHDNYIYISKDYGVTWTKESVSSDLRSWVSISSSSDGSRFVASSELNGGYIYTYTNSSAPVNNPSYSPSLPQESNASSNISSSENVNISRTLKLTSPRMIGGDVKKLQLYLNSEGYDCGVADGVFGTVTKVRVAQWQLANGLTHDGSFGPNSRAKAGL